MLKTRKTCRICNNPLSDILDLGSMSLPGYDGLAGHKFIQRKIPLVLTRCCPDENENACGLVQLRHTAPGSLIYPRYFYRSGINRTMTEHLHEIAQRAIDLTNLQPEDTVIDIGCNDGTSLAYYADKGFKNLYGFDPASNMAEHSRKTGATIVEDYFRFNAYRDNCPEPAKIISSIAMFYDLEDPNEFVNDIQDALRPDGIWVLELSYLPTMLEQVAFDTICHEHIAYYSLTVMENLLARHNLVIVDIYLNDTNGGSFQLYVGRMEHWKQSKKTQEYIRELKETEFEMGLDTYEPYAFFSQKVHEIRRHLATDLRDLKNEGKKVFAYGASTKGAITLQWCGIDNDLVECCADRNPVKWGTVINGTGIPIISEDEARARKPDYFLVLPWHFMKEFKEREKEFLDRGGLFIVPVPQVKIVGKE